MPFENPVQASNFSRNLRRAARSMLVSRQKVCAEGLCSVSKAKVELACLTGRVAVWSEGLKSSLERYIAITLECLRGIFQTDLSNRSIGVSQANSLLWPVQIPPTSSDSTGKLTSMVSTPAKSMKMASKQPSRLSLTCKNLSGRVNGSAMHSSSPQPLD
jgi:hypothetical protein